MSSSKEDKKRVLDTLQSVGLPHGKVSCVIDLQFNVSSHYLAALKLTIKSNFQFFIENGSCFFFQFLS